MPDRHMCVSIYLYENIGNFVVEIDINFTSKSKISQESLYLIMCQKTLEPACNADVCHVLMQTTKGLKRSWP